MPAPRSLAATDDVEGVPAHLTTLVPGERGHGRVEVEPRFRQRDVGSHNVLWAGDRVGGVVDRVAPSSGTAWPDGAHGASHLALRHGCAAAERFAAAYVAATGRQPEPYSDVVDLVGFLPAPGDRALAVNRAA